MRFSVFLTARSMGPDQDATIIQAMTDFAIQAEELGFDAVFCPDHHFTGYGPMGCDPFLFHGYLAGQLKRLHFGFSVVTGSLHHPVRFVERMNLLDQLTKGRLLVGIGSGTTPEETIGLLGWTAHTYQCVHVAESDAQARRELEFIVDQYQQAIDRERPYNKRAEQISGVDLPSAPDARSENWIKAWCLYGSPETVTAELRRYADTGVGNVLLSFTNGPFTEERWRLSQQSIRLFAQEVMPRFKSQAPVCAAAL